jgi:hypothetical protein
MQVSLNEYNPKRVIQILSGSRTGSSLLKSLLARSPDVTSLNGEEEPYFALSGNGFGMTSNSDAFTEVVNTSLFRRFIHTELHPSYLSPPWQWRLSLQFKGPALAGLLNEIQDLDLLDPVLWLRRMGIYGHYDGCGKEERIPFREMAYEMPPFVMLKPRQWPVNDTLLLKSPYCLHRPGVLEKIFPTAEFTYIKLIRNPAATINGLIDGWLAPYGFHKHLLPSGWWKFDLPPEWEQYETERISRKAWFQWASSATVLRERSCYTIRFEDLINSPQRFILGVCKAADIQPPTIAKLPHVMSTEEPKPYRWKCREQEILSLLNNDISRDLISYYGYQDQTRWY